MRKTFAIRLKSGMKEEYKRRHDHIWPEIDKMIDDLGIKNYSIWFFEDRLFAYYEVEEELPLTLEQQIMDERWQRYMSDIIEIVCIPGTNERMNLELMFLHE